VIDAATERYTLDVASAMAVVLGSQLAGVYLHGSAVLGGFEARRSDVDILVVCDGPASHRRAGRLLGARLPPAAVFGPVAGDLIAAQLAATLPIAS
jgi:predicted nucleotidyltransferase